MNKLKKYFLGYIMVCSVNFAACSSEDKIQEYEGIRLEEDVTSLLRNPCMGWTLYDDAHTTVQQAGPYWSSQDYVANKYASSFFIRWRWSDMEPEEGKYAWLYNENYKRLVKGALDRGLKLCIEVYDNGQDNLHQGTPDYVRQAGAQGYSVTGYDLAGNQVKFWQPYADDPVFQAKLTKFVEALGKEYDNPDNVDYVAGMNLGWWGEGNVIQMKSQTYPNLLKVFDWYTSMYANNFKKVIIIMDYDRQVGFENEKKLAIDPKNFSMRRCSLGSGATFLPRVLAMADSMFSKRLLVGEGMYWFIGRANFDPTFLPWKGIGADYTDYNSWREVYEQTYKDAIDHHFQTLDLREVPETQGWISVASDLVVNFMIKAGYRLHPSELILPTQLKSGTEATITHTWVNTGNGYLPNNLSNWNYKYKPAFALLDQDGNVAMMWIDNNAEPSKWLAGKDFTYQLTIKPKGLAPGNYIWAVAIIDKTKNNIPGIKLAIKDNVIINGWSSLKPVVVE